MLYPISTNPPFGLPLKPATPTKTRGSRRMQSHKFPAIIGRLCLLQRGQEMALGIFIVYGRGPTWGLWDFEQPRKGWQIADLRLRQLDCAGHKLEARCLETRRADKFLGQRTF